MNNDDLIKTKKVKNEYVDPIKNPHKEKKTSHGRAISKKDPDSEAKQPPKPQTSDSQSRLPPALKDFRVTPSDKKSYKREKEKKPEPRLPPGLRDFRVPPLDKSRQKSSE